MAKVAFLGLGVMGYPMAGHLKAKGHEVTVYNRNPTKAQAWVAQHAGVSAPTPPRPPRARRSSSPASATTTICAR
jgi:3-hydroxyisobutyrate dehydrogenase